MESSPISDDLEFLNALFTGMFNRSPESFELGEFYFPIVDRILTREQVIEQLRTKEEFIKARDILLAQKSIRGSWRKISDALQDFDPSAVGEIPGGQTNIANRPDDSDIRALATVVGMNSVIQAAIEEPSDVDQFKIESPRPSQEEGFLRMTLQGGNPGVGFLNGGGVAWSQDGLLAETAQGTFKIIPSFRAPGPLLEFLAGHLSYLIYVIILQM